LTYLDTQSALWLFEGKHAKFPKCAQAEIQRAEFPLISPIVKLELSYLALRNRARESAEYILNDLSSRVGLRVCDLPFPLVIEEAMKLGWTEDVFDRIIVAQASATNSKLITSDAHIQAHYKHAVWD